MAWPPARSAFSPDGLTYRFLLRPEARFRDGSALTAHDVVFSLTVLKEKGHPIITQLLRDFAGCEAADDTTVTVRFAPKRARDVPLFVAGLPIFSRAYYGKRPFEESTLDIPLGSGPYEVGRFEAGRYIEYKRVANWWGADLPVARGRHNFDTVRYDYYRDREVGFEGFTAKSYLFREEFTSRIWATRYNFPAIKDGRVKRDVMPDDTPSGAQGWFINTRQAKFQDARLREALGCAFDFEWTNKSIMYGSYQRTHSVFQNSDMMANGKPAAEELALLEPLRGKLSDEVFGEPFVPPTSDGSGQDRALLRRASQLLQDAGYAIKAGKRVSARGEHLGIEFLIDEPSFQAHHMPFIKNLATLGIDAKLRIIDPVQMQQRLKDFDFDLTIQRFSFSATPGDSLRNYFSSQAAAVKGSQNLAGIADPAIDVLIDRVMAASSRADLTIACRALDRVIRAGRYWIPHWYKASHWIAYWIYVRQASDQTALCSGVLETWWHDPHKASKIERLDRAWLRNVRRYVRIGLYSRIELFQRMSAYIIRRLLFMIPTLLGIMLVSFVVVQFAPGGPVERVIAQLSGSDTGASSRIPGSGQGGDFGGRGAQGGSGVDSTSSKYRGAQGLDPEFIKKLEKQFGFDKPAYERFFLMLKNFIVFDFGKSYFRDTSVMQLIKEKLPVSMSLGIWMTLLTYLISIPLGIRKAVSDGSRFDTWTSGVIIIGYAIPGFLIAIFLIILFAGGSYWDVFPLRGLTSDNWASLSWWQKILDYFWHLTLPIIAMMLSAFATMTLLTKNSFLDEIKKQYVLTARAKGCTPRQTLYGHIFRNAMLIVIAGFPSAFVHAFFSGSLLIETIFSLDGLGLLGFESVLNRDYPVVFATLYIFALIGLVVNLISDLTYTWIDPRIDFETREV